MEAEYFVFNDSREWQQIKEISVVLPNISITILPETLIIKSVYLCNLPRFVVATQNSDSILKPNFQCNKECHRLHRRVGHHDRHRHGHEYLLHRLQRLQHLRLLHEQHQRRLVDQHVVLLDVLVLHGLRRRGQHLHRLQHRLGVVASKN